MDEEILLQQELIENPPAPYTQLVEREWTTGLGASDQHMGKGDLVFCVPDTQDYLIVETKHLRMDTGRTARAKRNNSRKKVTEQAFRYGAIWRGHRNTVDGSVTMATYTNAAVNDDETTVSNNKLDILGQMDYLTPHLWSCELQGLLTNAEMGIMYEERFRRIFMAVRIHEPQEDGAHYSPKTFQKEFEKSESDLLQAMNDSESDLDDSSRPSAAYQSLEDIADAFLNRSGFYEPFGPHFVIAPNSQRLLLKNLQAFLRRLK